MSLKTSALCALLAAACTRPPRATIVTAAQIVQPCAPPRSLGVAPDGRDHRADIQRLLDACAGQVVTLEAGEYLVQTPSPRPPGVVAMLTLRPGTTLEGVGDERTTLKFVGDNQRLDWIGLLPASDTTVRRLALVSAFDDGTTAEQTHLVRVLGPVARVHLTHGSCTHPQSSTKVGDCVQVVGYRPDKLVADVEIDHWVFRVSGRSGVAVHSGLVGALRPDGHWSTRIHDNTFLDVSDNSVDGEGSGDTEGVEIDHNVFAMPHNVESAVALEVMYWRRASIHDNKIQRGVNLYGCDPCYLDHNEVVQTMPNMPGVYLRKGGTGTTMSDETYVVEASAGASPAIAVEQKITAPDHVRVLDTRIVQHTPAPAIRAIGVAGLEIRGLSVLYDGPVQDSSRGQDAVLFLGAGSAGCPLTSPPGVRADQLVLTDSTVVGPYRAVVGTSGSYCGAGSFEIRRLVAPDVSRGLRCEGVATGAGVLGPVTLTDVAAAPSACAPLLP